MKNSLPVAVSVDPGMGGFGWAKWELKHWRNKRVGPVDFGILKAKNSEHIEERCQSAFTLMKKLYVEHRVRRIYLEAPQFFAFSGKGHMAASRGDLAKLFWAAGAAAYAGWALSIEVVLVPLTWKGQWPKPVVENRVCHILGVPLGIFPSHACDAVGIGLFAKGAI